MEPARSGRAAHAGSQPQKGINALNAANLAMTAIALQRETFYDDDTIRVHPIITKGGDAVSAVPSEVTMETFVRGRTIEGIVDAKSIGVGSGVLKPDPTRQEEHELGHVQGVPGPHEPSAQQKREEQLVLLEERPAHVGVQKVREVIREVPQPQGSGSSGSSSIGRLRECDTCGRIEH